MGNDDEGNSSKSDKSPSPAPPDQTNIHVYPDWATMQAYYGPQVTLPPFYNPAVASRHAPHPYMWGPPQPMMAPYGSPYAAVYSHGGVYAHPAVPIAATPVSIETPTKSTIDTDRGLMKKLKGFGGLAMSIGNGNGSSENAEGGERRLSQSGLNFKLIDNVNSEETEGSSDGSNGNTAVDRKRSCEGTPTTSEDVKTETQASPFSTGQANGASDKALGASVAAVSVSGKPPSMMTALELRSPSGASVAKTSPTNVPQPCAAVSSEACLLNERDLKRERRKQSNRESARRSRLRKQAEAEELAHRVESLTSENLALKSEINQVREKSKKLRLENASLLEKLKNAKLGRRQETIMNSVDEQGGPTENLLSRVDNSAAADRNTEENVYDINTNSGTQLRQLFKSSPRADAVAAG